MSETDENLITSVGHEQIDAGIVAADFARRLESERDEARDAIRALAEHGESEIQRITKERDEAREEIDRYREKNDLLPISWDV